MKHITFMYKGRKYRVEPAGLIAAGILFLLILILLFALIFGGKKKKEEDVIETASPTPSASAETTPAATLDPSKYQGTILQETEDAGEAYIESTLFLGDSNTARFLKVINPDTQKTFSSKNNTIGVVGMGIDAISSLPCMDFSTGRYTMPQSVAILQPERVIIMMGTNNLSGSSTDATSFIQRYTAQIKAIEKAYPAADIIVSSIPPIAKNTTYINVKMAQIDAYNEAIAKMCEENKWKYLNSAETLIDASSGYAKNGYMVSDGLHLSQSGLSALFQYIRTHAWITEDDRPKPLAAIPNVIGVPEGLIKTDPLTSEEFKEDPSSAEAEPTITPSPSPSALMPAEIKDSQACQIAGYVWSENTNSCYESEKAKKAAELQLQKQQCLQKKDMGYAWDEETQTCIVVQPSISPSPEIPVDPTVEPVPSFEPEPSAEPEPQPTEEPAPSEPDPPAEPDPPSEPSQEEAAPEAVSEAAAE